jgi:hypothetical protein
VVAYGVGGQLPNPYSTSIPDTATLYAVLYGGAGHIIGGNSEIAGAAGAAHKTVGFTVGAPLVIGLGSYVPAQIGLIHAPVDPCDAFRPDPCGAVMGS